MGLAAISLPKTNSEEHEGLRFCTMEEEVRQTVGQSAGKVLLLSDDLSFAEYATVPRAISLVFDGDALPLFSMPDGISRVLAAGGEETLTAARYFAQVRQIPCLLFPSHAALCGVYEPRGEILLGEERCKAPLAQAEVLCDMERLKDTLADGFARVLLTRLAFYEAKALQAFGISLRAENAELPASAEEIVLANARARRAEAGGDYAGEGVALSVALHGDPCPCLGAYLSLTALYAAFFEKGRPRRYFTPDYRARAAAAGTEQSAIAVPSTEQYAMRAMTLERIRAQFTREILALSAQREEICATVSQWIGRPYSFRCDRAALKRLPERAPQGLSAIIRDFGLMEWNDDQGRTSAND